MCVDDSHIRFRQLDMLTLSVVLIFLKWFQSWFPPCWGVSRVAGFLQYRRWCMNRYSRVSLCSKCHTAQGLKNGVGFYWAEKDSGDGYVLFVTAQQKRGAIIRSQAKFCFLIVVLCSIALRDIRYILNKLLEEVVKIIIEAFF